MKNSIFLFICAFLLFFSVSVFSQEAPVESGYYYPQEDEPLAVPPDSEPEPADTHELENVISVYVIREIEFIVDGRSRPFALMRHGEFTYGERISGRENFIDYLNRKAQLLMNQRVLERVSIDYLLGETEADGALPVKLIVHVTDTWNIIALPYPQYDSNDGFSLSLRIRDYNFLGTMLPLRVDLGYAHDTDGRNSFSFMLDASVPFQAAGFDWVFRSEHHLSYTFDEPLFYQKITGISLDLPWRRTTFTVGINQFITFNERVSDENKDLFGHEKYFYRPYGSTEAFADWRIPIGFEVGRFGELAYMVGISQRINYPFSRMDEMDDPRKPVTTLRHSIGFGRINWVGNFRQGVSVWLGNSYSWFLNREDAPLRILLDGSATIHWPFSRYVGISSRLRYRHWWHWSNNRDDWLPYYYAGTVLRGVLNNHIRANYMLSLNVDFPFRPIRFWPSEWFDNPRLRIFNFEMHFSPFTDFALIQGPYNRLNEDRNEGIQFRLDDLIRTAGFEIIVFPGFFRSLYLRVSAGYNLERLASNANHRIGGFFPKWNELYIGMGHHF